MSRKDQRRKPRSGRALSCRLLVAITAHKCIDLIRHESRRKRGGPGPAVPGAAAVDLNQLVGREPTPEFALQVAEELKRGLARLDRTGDPELRQVALWKMEGETTAAIAAQLGCVRRTVERKLQLIASLWEREMQP